MSKKKPERHGYPLEKLVLDLISPQYENHPLRAYQLRREITRELGETVLLSFPEEGRAVPDCYTRDEYLEALGAPEMQRLLQRATKLKIAEDGRRSVEKRHNQPGGYRDQRKKHRDAYQASYDAGECTTHASFANRYAGTHGYPSEEKVLRRNLEGMPSARKKKTHTT